MIANHILDGAHWTELSVVQRWLGFPPSVTFFLTPIHPLVDSRTWARVVANTKDLRAWPATDKSTTINVRWECSHWARHTERSTVSVDGDSKERGNRSFVPHGCLYERNLFVHEARDKHSLKQGKIINNDVAVCRQQTEFLYAILHSVFKTKLRNISTLTKGKVVYWRIPNNTKITSHEQGSDPQIHPS